MVKNPSPIEIRSMLDNLLARVHRDGGQRAERVGLREATDEADEIVASLCLRSDELAARERERDEARDLAKLLQMVLLRSYEWVGFAPRPDRPEDADTTERLRQDVARAVDVARARTRGW